MNERRQSLGCSVRRIAIAIFLIVAIAFAAYALWRPGLDIRDGRHDRQSNGVWLAHGWLGGDEWFIQNNKTNEFTRYRSAVNLKALADKLRSNHITDLFPHLCPAEPTGQLPAVEANQVERFLDAFPHSRVLPWIGGPNGASARINNAKWRATFTANVRQLLVAHPRLAGVHLNIEPLPSGDKD